MIHCLCVDCEKKGKFKDLDEAEYFKWDILGVDMSENEFYAICPSCSIIISSVTVSDKPKVEPEASKSKIINSKSISYE